MKAETVLNAIRDSKKILITSHENPDCDALGSILSLGTGLKTKEKDVTSYLENGVPEHLKFLPGWREVKTDVSDIGPNFDLVILLDCTDTERPGRRFQEFLSSYTGGKIALIDHHKTNDSDDILSWIDDKAASTGVLIYKLLKKLKVEITPDIATCILATIIGDTGSFQFSNTNSEAFVLASKLVDFGADPEKISQAIYESESFNKIKLISEALKTLDIDETRRIATIYINKDMFKITKTSKEDTEGIVNIPRSIKGISVVLLLRQEGNNSTTPLWKVSIRSKDEIDVSEIASEFGGGGHFKAAGFSIKGTIEEAKEIVVKAVQKRL